MEAKAGTTIFASTGITGNGYPDRMSTLHFYKAVNGSKISLLNSNYYFNVATYSLNFDSRYIYSYCYQAEESWTTYNHDLSGDSYIQEDYIFSHETYFRVCLKRVDGKDFTDDEAKNINDILLFISSDTGYQEKACFTDEIQKTIKTIKETRTEKALILGVLSDSHFTINGTWEDTIYNIKAVNEKVNFDGIIHLGDLTDGMVSADVTKKYAKKVINDLKETETPIYIVIGNHDTNYFNNNLEPFSEKEQYEIYQKHSDNYVNRKLENLYYYSDFESVFIRCIFLTSFDYKEKTRYGFSEAELKWIKETLKSTPNGYSIVIFSHVPPLDVLDYWSDTIRNGNKLIEILEAYDSKEGNNIMAFIHGHTHADYVYEERLFPIISIGCSKCEYFTDKKPKGSLTQERSLNAVIQELWDAVIINPSENKIDFIRFGAGKNRTVYC